jgi:hypothetical protein
MINKIALFGTLALAAASILSAENITPTFATAPSGWVVDRYSPASFSNIGSYQGQNNVIGLGITNAHTEGTAIFYNTQGMVTPITGGAGDSVTAILYVPASWADAANGSRRTDEWIQTNDTPTHASSWGILGFTNFGGAARFRGWDETTGWIDFTSTVNYDSWNVLDIAYTAGVYDYSLDVYGAGRFDYTVNGVYAGSGAAPGHDALTQYFLQAYNFNGPDGAGTAPYPGGVANDYTADWANAPEPGTWSMMALASIAIFVGMRKRRAA